VVTVLILTLLGQAGGLNWAVKRGDLGAVRAFLAVGADPNYRDSFLATPLQHAVTNDRPEMVIVLMDSGANGNITSFGLTPLQYAINKNRADLVTVLLDHGADVNARTLNGASTALDFAVMRGYLPLAKLLIDRGADVRAADSDYGTPLLIASNSGFTEIVRLLLQKGADPNARDAAGIGPIDIVARRGDGQIARLLVEAGAKLNIPRADSGATPLDAAALNGHSTLVSLFLACNVDVTIKDKAGLTPLENAVRSHHTEIAHMLIVQQKGAAPVSGMLEQAVLKGWPDMVEMLLANGADFKTRFSSGSTSLHDAALKGYDGIVTVLLAKGADVNIRNASGATPLHDAALNGKASAVAILIEHGADINARETESGTTALYAAASLGRDDVAALLLEKGADPNICSKNGASPLHAALAGGSQSVADRIRGRGGRDLVLPAQ
jgi:ankyrin repeat protein